MKIKVFLKDNTLKEFVLNKVVILQNQGDDAPVMLNMSKTKTGSYDMQVTSNFISDINIVDKIEFAEE